MQKISDHKIVWYGLHNLDSQRYTCAYCSSIVASSSGYPFNLQDGYTQDEYDGSIYICPNCQHPTVIYNNSPISYIQIPGIPQVKSLDHLPDIVAPLYEEARQCMSNSSYTSVAMLCRKIIMNVAVQKGADPNKKFAFYVDYLKEQNYVPPNSEPWIKQIKNKGNEANHEIEPISESDAKAIIYLTHYMLLFIYEMPEKITS